MKNKYQPFFKNDFQRKISNPAIEEGVIIKNPNRDYEHDYSKVQSGIQNIRFSKMVQSSNGPEYDKKVHGMLFDHWGRLKNPDPVTQGRGFTEILKQLNENTEFRKYEITDDTLKEDYEVYVTFNKRAKDFKVKELPKFMRFDKD